MFAHFLGAPVKDLQSFCHLTNVNEDDVAHTFFTPTALTPWHMVVIDRENQAVVLCVRGTMSLGDVVTDVLAKRVAFLVCHCFKHVTRFTGMAEWLHP